MDATTTILLIVFAVLVFGFIIFAYRRNSSMYRIRIKKDFRNPARPMRSVFGIFNPNTNLIQIYSRLLSPFAMEAVAYFEPGAFADRKQISCYQGISGKQGDNNLVPISQELMSKAMCEEYAKSLSDKMLTDLNRIGIQVKPEDWNKIVQTFNADWVLTKLGVTDVKDANLFLQHHKVQIAAARSITNRYRDNNLSWFAKNQVFVGFLVFMIVMTLCTTLLWNGVTQDITAQAGALSGQNNSLAPTIQALAKYFNLHPSVAGGGTPVPAPNGTTVVT